MWLTVDDALIEHPKMFAAARHLGRHGRARAFCVYMACLSWVNRHKTDGFIPLNVVEILLIDDHPRDVAEVLSLEDVRLFHRESTGFSIHDYHDWNPDARTVKERLARDRERKRASRARVRADSERNPRGVRADSSALARARSGSGSGSYSLKTKGRPENSRLRKGPNASIKLDRNKAA